MLLNYKKFNPLAFYLLRFLQDITIRFVILYGGSSSGKSYSVAQIILLLTMWEGSNTLVMRKIGATIKDSIYQAFKVAAAQLGISSHFKFSDGLKTITCLDNDARIVFKGLDDSEKIKGLESFKRVVLDEWSEFTEADDKQIRLRLRGMEGQQIIYTFNPISESHWIKKKRFDTEKWHDIPMEVTLAGDMIPEKLTKVKSIRMNAPRTMMHKRTGEMIEYPPNTVVIQTTYLNNFWVVGSPDGKYGYYDDQCIATFEYDKEHDPDYYNVYALGEWGVIRSGSEFFGSFNCGRHTEKCEYDPTLPVHISVDSNVLPYISCTYWQVSIDGDKHHIRQIGETCAECPNNTVRKSAKLVAKKLHEMGVDRVIMHGDASTRAANNIDDEKRSFHDLFIDTLQKEGIEVEDKVSNKNPSVPMSGEFINAIWENMLPGLAITIDEDCPVSIEDYQSVQKDANGAILKTKVKNKITMQTYEAHGHLCFTPNTPVVTSRGILPISDVEIGDSVMTEKGWKKVYNSLCTIRNSQYFSLSLHGKRLDLTYDHPIYTNRGFVPAYQLKAGDIITRYSNGEIWQEKLLSTTVSNFIATLIANVRAIKDTIEVGLGLKGNSSRHTCTVTSGISPMAKYQTVIVYIISMVITITTHLIILPLCLLTNMRSFIQKCMAKVHGARLLKGWTRRKLKLKSGMHLKKGKNGILRMPSVCGKASQCVSMFAKSAARRLRAIHNTFQDFVQTTAKANGAAVQELTMKKELARCVGLNLLSISILSRSAVRGNVLLNIGGISDMYDISTTTQTFFANGILVHNCDTFRYLVVDVLRNQFLAFSNRRKRNTYARDGMIHFYNPATECKYEKEVVYAMPNVNGKFAMVHGKLYGEKWHVVNVNLMETSSTEDIRQVLVAENSDLTVIECAPAYFGFIRDLRNDMKEVRAMNEVADVDKRIAATSDFVKEHLLFNEDKLNDDMGYSAFMNNLLDYNKDSQNKEASAVLSGFSQYVVKFGFKGKKAVMAESTAS